MSQFVVNPYRCSASPGEMTRFLEVLGLRCRVSSGNGFALLEAGAGYVAVHPAASMSTGAQPGQTMLSLLADDAEDAASLLRQQGRDVVVWDESYGRHVGVVEPYGGGIWINEHQHDLYGYRDHGRQPADPRLTVTMVRPSDDFERDKGFFSAFGFVPDDHGNPWWQALRASSASGVIGLHRPESAEPPVCEDPGNPVSGRTPLVGLGFETAEPLEELAARLTAAGYPASVVERETTSVHVVDPDGCRIEIHPSSA